MEVPWFRREISAVNDVVVPTSDGLEAHTIKGFRFDGFPAEANLEPIAYITGADELNGMPIEAVVAMTPAQANQLMFVLADWLWDMDLEGPVV